MPWNDKDALTPQALNSRSGVVLNVKDPDFGVTGDGTTDDTTAIQAVITDAAAGSVVFFPQGNYFITTQLNLRSNIKLLGVGRGSRIFTAGDSVDLFRGTAVTNVAFSHLFLEGSGSDNVPNVNDNSRGIYIDGVSSGIQIRDCEFGSFNNAIFTITTSRGLIRGCLFLKNSGACWRAQAGTESTFVANICDGDRTGVGDEVDSINMVWLSQNATVACRNVTVVGNVGKNISFEGILITRGNYCTISGNTLDNVLTGVHIQSDTADSAQPTATSHITVVGNTIRNVTTGGGIRIGFASPTNTLSPHHNTIVGNVIDTTTGGVAGLALATDASDNLVVGNVVVNSATHGIALGSTASRNTIANNQVENSTQNGILVQGGTGNRVQGNYCYNNVQSGIRVTGATAADTIVEGNTCQDNDSATDGSGHGIAVVNGDHTTVRNNKCFSSDAAKFQLRGLVVSATPTKTIIENNDFRRNRTATDGISNSDTTAVLRGNFRSVIDIRGTAVLVAGTVTVATGEILAGDSVVVSRTTTGGTEGHLSVSTIVANTSFDIDSSNGADTSTIFWEIVH